MVNMNVVLTLIVGLGALGAGLGALKLNLLALLGLSPISRALKLICGLAGALVLYYLITYYDLIRSMHTPLEFATIIILMITNIGVGMSGFGTNVLRVLHVEALQKPLQLIAGTAGVYALSVGLKLLMQ